MTILNNQERAAKIDTQNVYGSVEELPNQCLHAFKDATRVEIPHDYKGFNSVVMAGMGGSGLGARVIESLYVKSLDIPLVRVNDYNLPGFVNKNTLLFCSSYSGNTEEVISCFKSGLERQSKIFSIGANGELIKLSKENNIPFYKIDPKYNPSNQPRMAIGYSIVGQLVLSSEVGLFKFEEKDILVAIDSMKNIQEDNKIEIDSNNNPSKKLAEKFQNNKILLVSSEHLVGATHVFNNQLNENSKVLTADYVIPELNHHLMEGLKNPESNIKDTIVIFVQSDLYSNKIQKRMELTKEVVEKNKVKTFTYKLNSPSELSQVFELIQFGAFVNYYLALLYNQNPAPIPWVDYFKKKLKEQK